jgi:hypothetical protein
MKRMTVIRWTIALLILGFGVLSHDPKTADRWFYAAVLVYAVPLLAQFIPRTWVRVYGIYFGLFVMLQAIISSHWFPDTYKTRAPYINAVLDIRGNNLPGISGLQHMQTDAKGFRATKPVNYDAKAPYRIFFVGASTVAQDWVGDRKTFPHLVQESLTKALNLNIETVNTAVPGLRAIHHLETMRRVAKYHPDMYVIVPGANDWGLHITLHYDKDNTESFAHTEVHVEAIRYRVEFLVQLRRYTLKHSLIGRFGLGLMYTAKGLLAARANAVDKSKPRISYALFYRDVRGSLLRKDKRTFKPKSVHPNYAETMREIVAFCKKSRVVCVLATHPHSFKPGTTRAYRQRFWMTPAFEKYTLTFESMAHIASLYNRHLIELGRTSGLPVCDLESKVAPSLENFYDEIHYNLEGSRKAAAVLQTCLLEVIRSKVSSKQVPAE